MQQSNIITFETPDHRKTVIEREIIEKYPNSFLKALIEFNDNVGKSNNIIKISFVNKDDLNKILDFYEFDEWRIDPHKYEEKITFIGESSHIVEFKDKCEFLGLSEYYEGTKIEYDVDLLEDEELIRLAKEEEQKYMEREKERKRERMECDYGM